MLCDHIWEHYRFTRYIAFLRQYCSALKGAARFLTCILIKEPKYEWLITAPSNSAENAYRMPGGFVGQTCMGSTMDMQMCWDIFSATIHPAQILRRDQAFANRLQGIITKLAPDQISPTGVVCSSGWTTGLPRIHITAILRNYSGSFLMLKITPWDTPDLVKTAKKTLELRGNGETGWSRAWKISFRGRLGFGSRF